MYNFNCLQIKQRKKSRSEWGGVLRRSDLQKNKGAKNNLKSGCRKQVQKTSAENKYRKQIQKTSAENKCRKQINNNLNNKIMKTYMKLNVHTTGTITIKNTRKKLYNYLLVDCNKEYIKEYLLKHKNATVFFSSKQYAPEIKNYMIATKATNFDKYASIEDKETFKKQRINFLNN